MASPSSLFSPTFTETPTSPSYRSAFPFPSQDASSRPSSSRYQPRRGSGASIQSVGSIGGSLDIPRRGSTVRETSQNAISTLLQPPIVRTGLVPHTQASAAAAGYRAPTTKDIPPVALTNVPTVPQGNFREYLTKIGPLFESLQRGRAEPEQTAWLKKDKDLGQTDRFAEALERRVSSARNSTPNSPALSRYGDVSPLSSVDTPTKRRSSGQVRRNRNEPTPLSTIPGVYFDDQFHLENPRTFDVVSENAEIVRPPPGTPQIEQRSANGSALPPRKALATNAILQEKLSWYMDTVEVHLINSISTASSGFFAALGSLKELQTEAEESVAKIQGLREDLRRLDQEVAVSGLEVAAKRRRRENVVKLSRATAQVQSVVENVKKADALVDEGSYDAAADQMGRVGRLVCGQAEVGQEDQELIDLRPLKALQGLASGLQELQLRIGTGFAHRFTSILIDDLRAHVEKVADSDTLKRWSRQRAIPPTYMETSPELRADLLSALSGLARAGHTAPATATYREAVNKEMKTLIRKFLPSSSDDDADSMISTSTRGGRGVLSQQEKSSILARNLRALDPEDAEKLLVGVYTSVGEALRRVSTQTKILLDVTSSMEPQAPTSPRQAGNALPNGNTPKITVQEELSQTLNMSSLLGVAVDTAQTQITRILKVRNEQGIRLSVPLFLRYFRLNRLFADECEAVSGRGGNVLKGIINAQISGFVQVLGTSETERIAGILDGDVWNAEDFTPEDDVLLQRILSSEKSDPTEWTNATIPLWEDATPPTTNGTTASAETTTKARPAKIGLEIYPLPKSAIALLPTLTTFLSLTTVFHSSITPAITTSLLESLKQFNSRSCQLILGAGATRSAGLKNITTKHLALAFQSLAFVLALLPSVRSCFTRHGGQGMSSEFEKFERLVKEHQSGIRDKLVEIMGSRSASHVKAMMAINFDATGGGGEGLSPYMETLTKETLTLHRVLGRYLSDEEVKAIMGRIRDGYKEQWVKAFKEVPIKTSVGKGRLGRDAGGFAEKLGKVEGFEGVGREVKEVVEARTVAAVKEVKKADEKKDEKKEKEGEMEVMFEADEEEVTQQKDDEKKGSGGGGEEKK